MVPAPAIEDPLFGAILQDSYKIIGLLGKGGMGTVYDALHIRLNNRVAVKVIAHELVANSEALSRFRREAMITSGLGHPHIVQVFDFSTTPHGQPFFAMEFLDGEDLHRRIARVGRLSPKRTVQIVRQVASALAATHAKQIVHRDLKPANIYLLQIAGEDDFVKVLDFGISKILDANTKITRGTVLMGTPNYMSPEQAMGMAGEVDHRSDEWSLACIAWECLSGASPFVADSVPAMLYQVVHGDPVPFAAPVAGLPHGVHAVLQRALSKNKEERFPSVIEFAQALENAIQGKPAVVQVTEAVTAPVSAAKTEIYEAVPVDTRDKRPAESLAPIAGGIAWSQDRAGRPKWQWAVAGLGVSVIGLATIFALRPTAKERPRSSPISAPGPAFTLPTSAPTATFEPKQGQVPAPLPPAGAGTLPRAPAPDPEETETAQASPDSNVTTPNADGRARPKKAAAGVRMKNKTTRSERRLIKEL